MHGKAKEQAEIDGEKEIVETSTIQAIGKNKYGNVTQKELEEKLNSNAGNDKTEVIDNGDTLVVKFIDSGRYYEVDNYGNVENIKVIVDSNPGNIKIGINGEKLKGTEESPFEIWCIEDLVEWSQNYSSYLNSYIKLGRTLNFNSSLSYTDGKVLNCNSINELKELLTNTSGNGFTPINTFAGDFDGQDFEIQNIYIKNSIAGLIGKTLFDNNSSTIIKNISITGNIICTTNNAGGIIAEAYNSITIVNCKNMANITKLEDNSGTGDKKCIGGIIGYTKYNDCKIIKCSNYGIIKGKDNATGWQGTGGILGYGYGGNQYIYNCCNFGDIEGGYNVGGIIGCSNGNSSIYNCCNNAKIAADVNLTSSTGGIVGYATWNTNNIVNCYNTGELDGKKIGGILGNGNISDDLLIISKCYFLNTTATQGFGNRDYGDSTSLDNEVMKSIQIDDNQKSLLTMLNEFVNEYNEKNTDTIELDTWILNKSNGYPILN